MDKPKIKKGFLQVNITGFIWHPMSEVEKQQAQAMGDFVEVQPIMYDVLEVPMIAPDASPHERAAWEAELKKLPDGLLQETHNVLEEISKLIRLHKPDPTKIVPIGVRDPSIKPATPKLLNASGDELKPTKH